MAFSSRPSAEPGSRVTAAFQTLPGNQLRGRRRAAPRDAALASAVAELRLINGWTLIGKFDGEFSDRSHTLAGTGILNMPGEISGEIPLVRCDFRRASR